MIAITFALPVESAGIIRALLNRKDENRIIYGKLGGCEVAIFHTGVGRKACERSIDGFLNTVRPGVLISAGFAGGLTDDLQVADAVIGQNVSDPNLATQLIEKGTSATDFRARAVKLVTIDSMIDTSEDRRRLAAKGADAVDMETEVIAKACAERGIRLLSLRAISDTPAAPFPAPPRVLFNLTRQRTNFAKLIPYVLIHPSAIGGLVRFARQISGVRRTLTAAVLDAVTRFGT